MVEKPHLVSCLGLASGLPVSQAVVSPLTPGLFLDALPCHPEWGQLEAALQVPSRVPACTRTRVSLRPPPASAGHSQQSVTACTEQRQGKGDGQKGSDGVAWREVWCTDAPLSNGRESAVLRVSQTLGKDLALVEFHCSVTLAKVTVETLQESLTNERCSLTVPVV